MKKTRIKWKTNMMLIIILTFLMMAAASVNADTIREVTVIDHEATNAGKGELIEVSVQKDEPIIIAPMDVIKETDVCNTDDTVISPHDINIVGEDKDTDNSQIATNAEKTEDTINQGIPAFAGIGIICCLIVTYIVIKRKK